jgi:small subunit ribosomal protein S4
LGWAPSRAYARQLVSHRHIVVNGKRVNIPSYLVKKDDIILLRKKEGMQIQDVNPPAWLSLNKEEQKACVLSLPQREHIDVSCNEELIATFYSR